MTPAPPHQAAPGPTPEPGQDATSTEASDAQVRGAETGIPLVPLLFPADGVPDIVADERRLVEAATALGAGSGPLAIDAERASGYRYGQRAYLVQLRREGAGTWLIDPIGCPDMAPIGEAIAGVEWVLHAATQDLPCLAEVGLRPSRLFDTELGGRLVGLPRVGLATVVEHYLGLSLAKEHSAVDWSTRPLPEPWLRYAALDVEVLVQVRDRIAADLWDQGKQEWAEQEFAALTTFTGPPPRHEPWRRTSGMHRVRGRRGAALVRELWLTRDAIALERDVAPGRILPDAALVALAARAPHNADEIGQVSGNRSARRYQRHWLAAIERAERLPESALPAAAARADGPPPQRAWTERDPVAAERLALARTALQEFAAERTIPVENILAPDVVRRLLWDPPPDRSVEGVARALADLGARPWQVQIGAELLATALANHPPART